jgi:hypothetical protein
MSWSELERLVCDAEADAAMQRALKHCRSRKELILAARRLGYRIPASICSGPGRSTSSSSRKLSREG